MAGSVLFTLSIIFATIAGAVAGILSLVSWEIFRRSPYGRAIFALSIVLSVFTIYHVILLLVQGEPVVAKLVKSLIFTGLVVFIALMIETQRRIHTGAGVD